MKMDLAAMDTLHAEDVAYLVFHTAGSPHGVYQTVEEINEYHLSLGWPGIGYHFYIDREGLLHSGRPLTKMGAHALGLNRVSIGICFAGNGDIYPLTPEQMETGLDLGARLARLYDVPIENVIGHREINRLVESGVLASKYLTTKSCPGHRISPHALRLGIAKRLFPAPDPVHIDVPDIGLPTYE